LSPSLGPAWHGRSSSTAATSSAKSRRTSMGSESMDMVASLGGAESAAQAVTGAMVALHGWLRGRPDKWHGNVEFRALSLGGLSVHAVARIVLGGNASKWCGRRFNLGKIACTSNAMGARSWLPIWMSSFLVRSGWRSRAGPYRRSWPSRQLSSEVFGGRSDAWLGTGLQLSDKPVPIDNVQSLSRLQLNQ
jgi:hypothetical protein